ncbi:FlgO family outer membrane protein [bacterium]
MRLIKVFPFIFFYLFVSLNTQIFAMAPEKIMQKLDDSLDIFPGKIAALPPEFKRINFYSLYIDKEIPKSLTRQIYGKLESIIIKEKGDILVYAPEIRPVKITYKKNMLKITSKFNTTKEIKDISERLKLDGILLGELYIAKNSLYLNLRIIDSSNMEIVWSEEFTSEKKSLKTRKTAIFDIGAGVNKMQIDSDVAAYPDIVEYLALEARLLQRIYNQDDYKLTFTFGLTPLYKGIEASQKTIISDQNLLNIYGKIGLRASLIPSEDKGETNEVILRDWLAVELSLGKMLGKGINNANLFTLKVESDFTKNISSAIGFTFVSKEELIIDNNKVKIGGLMYEISLIRVSFVY